MAYTLMPITTELQNAQKLRDAGFTQQQAETLAEIVENGQQQGFERFAETLEKGLTGIRNEIAALESRLDTRFVALEGRLETLKETLNGRIDSVRGDLRAELHASLRDQMLKFVAILVAALSLAVAIIKLFPNLN